MSLLNRIACSNGNPKRTTTALHLINKLLMTKLEQSSTNLEVDPALVRLRQICRTTSRSPYQPASKADPGSSAHA
jgi:hypothetical protein